MTSGVRSYVPDFCVSSQVLDECRKCVNFLSSVGALVLAHVRLSSHREDILVEF